MCLTMSVGPLGCVLRKSALIGWSFVVGCVRKGARDLEAINDGDDLAVIVDFEVARVDGVEIEGNPVAHE